MSSRCRALLPLLLACGGGVAAAPEGPAPLGVGMAVDASRPELLGELAPDEAPPAALVRLSWGAIEREPGQFDWSVADRTVEALAAPGRHVTIELAGPHPEYLVEQALPSPLETSKLDAWLVFVRGAVSRYAARVHAFQIGGRLAPEDVAHVDLLSLAIKQSSLAVRAEARAGGARPLVVLPAVPARAVELRQALWEQDLAAYVDVLPVLLDPRTDASSELEGLASALAETVLHPPAPQVWAYVEPVESWRSAELALEALAGGAARAYLPLDPGAPEGLARWIAGMEALLAGGHAPAPASALRLEPTASGQPRRGSVLGRFFSDREFTTLVPYTTGSAAEGWDSAPLRLVVDAVAARDAFIVDPLTGTRRSVAATPAGPGELAFVLYETSSPRALVFGLGFQPGFEMAPEEVDISSRRGLTAEEIIARYQEVQREQDHRFERLLARGRTEFHFRIAEGGSTIDVAIDSQYFLERGGQLEWEQLDYYINGSRVGWKSFPRLPLVQPEKVNTLPLDLTLDESYGYRLRGEERVGERPAWILEFEPADPGSPLSLYRGRVWIDQERFVRLKVALVQGNLEPPVISNEEVDHYTEQLGPDGSSFWLLTDVTGQQVWNIAGRSFVVRRTLHFSDFEINPPPDAFASRRSQAYASRNTMLRDTASGFRYLEPTEGGERVVKEEIATSQFFAGGGLYEDGSRDHVLPLAAVNYFDFDLFGRDVQANVLFAGVFAAVNLSKPDLAGGRMDLTLDALLSALEGDDRLFAHGVEQTAERLEVLPERLALRAGLPLGEFFKLSFIAGFDWRAYSSSDESEEAIEAYNAAHAAALDYVVPQDHSVLSGSLEASFNRRGWSLSGEATLARRSEWELWGLRDTASGVFGRLDPDTGLFVATGTEPVLDSFTTWRAGVFKDWFLPRFQKVRGELSWLDGRDLDRFSRHQFSYLGAARLNGFAGSGVRFDRGGLVRAGYSFNLLGALRLDLALDGARIEDLASAEGFQSFGGVGINGNLPAPWKTVINFSYGRAVLSDIPELEGEDEFLLLILKLF